MRNVLVATIAVLAAAGCGANAPAPAPPTTPPPVANAAAAFPDLFQAAYRAEALITLESGSIAPVLMIRDGRKLRLETRVADQPVVRVMDRETGAGFVITTTMGRAVVATLSAGQPAEGPDMWWDGEIATSMDWVGVCSHLGQAGTEWERASADGPQHACVTDDGIVLWATNNGRTIWQLTSLQRGPQDGSQFALPVRRVREEVGETGAQGDATLENYTPPQFRTEPPPQAE